MHSRHFAVTVAALSLAIIALVLAILWKLGFLNLESLARNREAFSAIQSITTTIVISFGAVFSYFKFFHGRIFSPKAILHAEAFVHPTDTDELMHVLMVTLENTGAYTIWNPQPSVEIITHGAGNSSKQEKIPREKWRVPAETVRGVTRTPGIDSDERASYYVRRFFPKGTWAVTYEISLLDETGHSWSKTLTVANST